MGYYVENPAHAISYVMDYMKDLETKLTDEEYNRIHDALSDLEKYFNNKQGD